MQYQQHSKDGSTTKTVDGVGTYTVAPDGTVTFTPVPSFVGKAPSVTVVREDMNGTKASAKYTPTVTPVTPTATPAESVAPQGIVQTGTVTFTEGDPVAPINKETITLLDENGQPLLEPSGGFLHVSGAKVYYDTNLTIRKTCITCRS